MTLIEERLSRVEEHLGLAPFPEPTALRAPEAPPAWLDPAPGAAPPSALPPIIPPSPEPEPAAPRRSLEDLLAGRVLAWTGGLAVLLGLVFLLAIAVSNGWIGETARTALAGLASAALVVVGARLHERRGRTEAALAAVAAGVAGMFVTVTVGGPVYGVLPDAVAVALALVTGAVATALAVRWQAKVIAALGLGGALVSPALAGMGATGPTLAIVFAAGLAATGVLVWQRWSWLSFGVFLLALPQWTWWLFTGDQPLAGSLVVLAAFAAVNVAAAIAFELRVPTARLRASSALLLTLNALAAAAIGWFALADGGHETAGHVWLFALALAHVAAGLIARAYRINPDIRLLALALGVVLVDVAAASVLDGLLLAAVWSGGAALAAAVARRTRSGEHGELVAGLGLGGHLLLAAGHALVNAPPADVLAGDAPGVAATVGVACAAAAAFAAGRIAPVDGESLLVRARPVLDAVALAGLAYLTVAVLDGPVLVAALAAEALALAAIARRDDDEVASLGALGFLAVAAGHTLAIEAPPAALVEGLDAPLAAAAALGAVALAALRMAAQLEAVRTALHAVAGVTTLYLASTLLVTPFQPGEDTALLLDLGARQQGQVLLSALWAIVGTGALVAGLRRDVRELRLAALALLLITVAKVFLYDLATLTSLYRVVSFVALGLLLLLAAGTWQRLRPDDGTPADT